MRGDRPDVVGDERRDVAVAPVLAQRRRGLPQREVRRGRAGEGLVRRREDAPGRVRGVGGLPGEPRGLRDRLGADTAGEVGEEASQRRVDAARRASRQVAGEASAQASGSARRMRSAWKPWNDAQATSGPTAPSGAARWAT